MALTAALQADVDEVRAVATAYEALEERVLTLKRKWDRGGNNDSLPEAEVIAESATGDDDSTIAGVIGGDVKKAVAALNKRFTETLVEGGENTLNSISKVALP